VSAPAGKASIRQPPASRMSDAHAHGEAQTHRGGHTCASLHGTASCNGTLTGSAVQGSWMPQPRPLAETLPRPAQSV
jgi:hypothetical protein